MYRFLFFIFFMSFNSFANQSELDSLISNYIYDMTVEWNQKDEKYAAEKIQLLQAGIQELLQKGLSLEEIQRRLKKVSPTGVSWNGKVNWRSTSYVLSVLTISLVIALSYNDNSDPVCSVTGNWVEVKCDGPGNCYHYFHETCE